MIYLNFNSSLLNLFNYFLNDENKLFVERFSKNKFVFFRFNKPKSQFFCACRAHKTRTWLKLSVFVWKSFVAHVIIAFMGSYVLFKTKFALMFIFSVQVVLQYVKNFTSLDSIFHALRLPSEDSVAAMKGVFCLQRNNTMLNSLIEQLNGTENVNLTFKNPVCDNTVVQDLVRMAVPAARKVFAARTRDELCRLVLMKCTQILKFLLWYLCENVILVKFGWPLHRLFAYATQSNLDYCINCRW